MDQDPLSEAIRISNLGQSVDSREVEEDYLATINQRTQSLLESKVITPLVANLFTRLMINIVQCENLDASIRKITLDKFNREQITIQNNVRNEQTGSHFNLSHSYDYQTYHESKLLEILLDNIGIAKNYKLLEKPNLSQLLGAFPNYCQLMGLTPMLQHNLRLSTEDFASLQTDIPIRERNIYFRLILQGVGKACQNNTQNIFLERTQTLENIETLIKIAKALTVTPDSKYRPLPDTQILISFAQHFCNHAGLVYLNMLINPENTPYWQGLIAN